MKKDEAKKLQQDLDNMNIVVRSSPKNDEKLFGLFDQEAERPFFTFIQKNDFKKDLLNSLEEEIRKLKELTGESDNLNAQSYKKDHREVKVNYNLAMFDEPKKQLKQLILLYQVIAS